MRCPRCLDEYDAGVAACVTCGAALVPDDAEPAVLVDAQLGSFHPVMADRIEALLAHREVAYRRIDRDDEVALLVDRAWQGDLRAELALTWPQLVAALPPERALEVRRLAGATPGWFDAPEGGWVDRAGRFVVDGEEASETAARVIGPGMATLGALVAVLAWYTDTGPGLILTGLGLFLVGALIPR